MTLSPLSTPPTTLPPPRSLWFTPPHPPAPPACRTPGTSRGPPKDPCTLTCQPAATYAPSPPPAQGHVLVVPLPSQQVFGRAEPATSASDLSNQLHLKEAAIRAIRQGIAAAEGQFERRRAAALVTRVTAAAAAVVAAENLPLPPVAQSLLSATDMARTKAQERMARAAALLAVPPLPGSHPTPGPFALHEPYKDAPWTRAPLGSRPASWSNQELIDRLCHQGGPELSSTPPTRSIELRLGTAPSTITSASPSLSPSISSRTMPHRPGCSSPGSPPLSEWAPLNRSVIVSPTTFVCTSMTPTLATQCGGYCVLTWPLVSPSPTTD
jgi:hypothetical protein